MPVFSSAHLSGLELRYTDMPICSLSSGTLTPSRTRELLGGFLLGSRERLGFPTCFLQVGPWYLLGSLLGLEKTM